MEQKHRLLVGHVFAKDLNQVIGIAVAEEQVKIAVVVIVKKLQSPAAHEAGSGCDPVRSSRIVKSLTPSIE